MSESIPSRSGHVSSYNSVLKRSQSQGHIHELVHADHVWCGFKMKHLFVFVAVHADYCLLCISEHKKRRNTCPTCRTPISGTLECRPAQPDDE